MNAHEIVGAFISFLAVVFVGVPVAEFFGILEDPETRRRWARECMRKDKP